MDVEQPDERTLDLREEELVVQRTMRDVGEAHIRTRVEEVPARLEVEANAEEVGRASLVLLDPPYNDAVLEHALARLDVLVAASTTIVAEHSHRQALPDLRRLRPGRLRRYGDTAVTVLVAE